MADRFHASISNSGNWWSSTSRPTGSFASAPPMSTAASFSCSTELIASAGSSAEGGFSWPATPVSGPVSMLDAKSRPSEESAGSTSSVIYQDVQFSHPRSSIALSPPMLDARIPSLMDFGLFSPTFDWNQPFFSTKTSGRPADQTNSFHALVQEDAESNRMQAAMGTSALPISPVLKSMNQAFLHEERPAVNSGADNAPIFSSSLPQGLFKPVENRLHKSFYPNQPPNFSSPINCYEKLGDQTPMMQSSSLVKPPPPQLVDASQPKQHMQFSNETPFWNPSATAATDACSSFYYTAPTQPVQHENSGHSNLTGKPNSRGRNNSNLEKSTCSSEPVQKKARIETPSPLPTFKVRKEKLGDRITALQQLVSPFGKTDTASVLHEAIDYIKFLHDQVRALSTPYLKNGHQMQQVKGYDKSKERIEGSNRELQSQGLCLVPISSTFVVASETPVDFWTPVFGGAYR